MSFDLTDVPLKLICAGLKRKVTDDSLRVLIDAGNCRLRILHLQNLKDGLTDAGLQIIAPSCKFVTSLRLFALGHLVTDSSIRSLAECGCGAKLKFLHVVGDFLNTHRALAANHFRLFRGEQILQANYVASLALQLYHKDGASHAGMAWDQLVSKLLSLRMPTTLFIVVKSLLHRIEVTPEVVLSTFLPEELWSEVLAFTDVEEYCRITRSHLGVSREFYCLLKNSLRGLHFQQQPSALCGLFWMYSRKSHCKHIRTLSVSYPITERDFVSLSCFSGFSKIGTLVVDQSRSSYPQEVWSFWKDVHRPGLHQCLHSNGSMLID